MSSILITGAGGFVGAHLLSYLAQHTDHSLHGTTLGDAARSTTLHEWHTLDLRDAAAVDALVGTLRPAQIYHLAGQSFVPRSFEAPWETLETNIRTLLNLFDAIRHNGLIEDTRVLVVGSAEMYGAVAPDMLPITEHTPFNPSSPYAVSKIGQDMLAAQYAKTYGIQAVRVRPFNHIGPCQTTRFAIASFAAQIAQIEQGGVEPIVRVGNLTAERDLTDVRDVVRAYHLTIEHGAPGGVYNVCAGVARSMQSVLDHLVSLSSAAIRVEIDPARFRPADIPRLVGDYGALHAQTGWQPQVPLDQTLRDILDDARQRLATD